MRKVVLNKSFWQTWNRFLVNMGVVVGTVGVVQPIFTGRGSHWLILFGIIATMAVMGAASCFSFFIDEVEDV